MKIYLTLVGIAIAAIASHAQSRQLCIAGHPAPRPLHLTYGHMHCQPGFVRDHIIPLCAGGSDTAANIQCQEARASYEKDERERKACEDYCAGRISIATAKRRGSK